MDQFVIEDYVYYDPDFDEAGERYRPVHKPYKASQCDWVQGYGWVYNPTHRQYEV